MANRAAQLDAETKQRHPQATVQRRGRNFIEHDLADWNALAAKVTAAWASLANEDVIADGSGLAGVSSLTKAEIASIATAMQAILTTYNGEALRQLYVRMAGMTNTVG